VPSVIPRPSSFGCERSYPGHRHSDANVLAFSNSAALSQHPAARGNCSQTNYPVAKAGLLSTATVGYDDDSIHRDGSFDVTANAVAPGVVSTANNRGQLQWC
jgi:NAD(P)-dependent dehydrogenase (short-subunit alcohol dehydrogenase family)